jgi:hypothetical protein
MNNLNTAGGEWVRLDTIIGAGLLPYGPNLPIFPTLHGPVCEARLENVIAGLYDSADAVLTGGRCTQRQYHRWVNALNEWARQYETPAPYGWDMVEGGAR